MSSLLDAVKALVKHAPDDVAAETHLLIAAYERREESRRDWIDRINEFPALVEEASHLRAAIGAFAGSAQHHAKGPGRTKAQKELADCARELGSIMLYCGNDIEDIR